ncbi:MAG: cation:proton antiporter [Candidatus Cloacimonetes bacterium]|nr:cation:proton antiporter [Candidatus Cloacimonadota bacterium]MCF7813871.1 cation:proton antiporter [Candidatus Cloacimonadota bacterium]MCF7868918.1 cation:proton antiporter [Candidatus Cloacimonadota bacterium]MCF7883983.1 cation:proton antiporter [Candidatus Cloacimonadota bacterium]
MNSTFFLIFMGGSILLALLLAKGTSLVKSPFVVGYIIAGAIIGPAVLSLINYQQIESMNVINTITLSFLGFGIGGELKFKELKKLGKSIFAIVFFEATAAFLVVGIATTLILHNIGLGLIYGALASATAPAGTVDVIRQYKAKGNLTTTLFAVMGLDDIYALIIFTISIPIAIILLGGGKAHPSVLHSLGHSGIEIAMEIGIGVIVGFILIFIAKRIHDRVMLLLFTLGIILLNCGISQMLEISPILLNMAVGIVVVNNNAVVARRIFAAIGDWSPPIYVWFFVLVGTRLDIHLISKYSILILIYIFARSSGKWGGAFAGAKLSKAPSKTIKYLGLTLLSQAGVAIGLALAASTALEKLGMITEAKQVMGVMTATTFLIMLIGPILAKIALVKAGETHAEE